MDYLDNNSRYQTYPGKVISPYTTYLAVSEGVYVWKIQIPNHPMLCTVLFLKIPRGTRWGKMLGSKLGPSGCLCIRYQKPKCVPVETVKTVDFNVFTIFNLQNC